MDNSKLLQIVALFVLFADALAISCFAVLIYGKYFNKSFLANWKLPLWKVMMAALTLLVGYLFFEYLSIQYARDLGQGVVFYGLFLTSTPTLFFGFLNIFLKP